MLKGELKGDWDDFSRNKLTNDILYRIPLNPHLNNDIQFQYTKKFQKGTNPEQNWCIIGKFLKVNRNKLPFNNPNLPFNKWLFFNWF